MFDRAPVPTPERKPAWRAACLAYREKRRAGAWEHDAHLAAIAAVQAVWPGLTQKEASAQVHALRRAEGASPPGAARVRDVKFRSYYPCAAIADNRPPAWIANRCTRNGAGSGQTFSPWRSCAGAHVAAALFQLGSTIDVIRTAVGIAIIGAAAFVGLCRGS
jgi:hypothetical protein